MAIFVDHSRYQVLMHDCAKSRQQIFKIGDKNGLKRAQQKGETKLWASTVETQIERIFLQFTIERIFFREKQLILGMQKSIINNNF